jgi:hypothetical protein
VFISRPEFEARTGIDRRHHYRLVLERTLDGIFLNSQLRMAWSPEDKIIAREPHTLERTHAEIRRRLKRGNDDAA